MAAVDGKDDSGADLPTHAFGSTTYQPSLKGQLLFELRSWLGRTFTRAGRARNPYLNLGSGANVVPGFENLDLYLYRGARNVVGHDFRYPLPYVDACFQGAYSEHALEHLYPDQALRLLAETARVLQPGSVFRIGVPDLGKYVNYYTGKPTDPEFGKFRSGCEAIWSLTQNWGHLSVWDGSMLVEKLLSAGFSEARQTGYRQGRNPKLLIDQEARRWETLYVEAVR
jgi:SAM-dependent methyltransferase